VLLLWITHITGIRVTELALLEVADVFYSSGQLNLRCTGRDSFLQTICRLCRKAGIRLGVF